MRIALDVGGVLSKYPDVFRRLLQLFHYKGSGWGVECWIISDMHPESKIVDMLERNGMLFYKDRVRSADYATHGERCKAVLCQELGIDILIDDFPGYLAVPGMPLVRLLVMPDPDRPYYDDNWQTDGSEGSFGRRTRPTKGDHVWP